MSDAPAPGDTVGRYRIVAALGEGGMGAVFEAARTDLPLRVALKTMHPAMRARPEAVQRFLREAEALATMRHPHVVEVVDFGTDDAHGPWFAMRLLDGESLATRLARSGPMTPAQALAWALPVIAGLRHAHGLGVVHRDLKPDNVFLARTDDGHDVPLVIDFGAARTDAAAPSITASGVMIGTPLYMAPEQLWGGRHATARSDQYALAFTLYECLAGAPPFEAESLVEVIQRVQAGGFTALADRAPQVPAGLSDAVMRALSTDPDARFADLAAFARALLPWADVGDRARWSAAFGADTFDTPAPREAAVTVDAPPRAVVSPISTAPSRPEEPSFPEVPAVSPAPPARAPAPRIVGVVAFVALATAALAWALRAPSVEAPAPRRADAIVDAHVPDAVVLDASAPRAVVVAVPDAARGVAPRRAVRAMRAHGPVDGAATEPRGANGAPIRE